MKFTPNFASAVLPFLTLLPLSSYAAPCVSIEVLNDRCDGTSFKADLAGCEDDLVALQRIRCSEDQIQMTIRGKTSDYRVTLKNEKGAWNTAWKVDSEIEVPHRRTEKTLPKTEHERTPSPPATLLIPEPEASTPGEPKVSSAITFQGYFDAYAEMNFNRPSPASIGAQNNLRYYDNYANQISLQLAELTIKHVRKETTFVMDLDFGNFADLNTQTARLYSSGGPEFYATNEVTKHIGQAIFTYTPSKAPRWIFEVGKMPTHVGLELMKAKDNWNYTRSTLFGFGGPFWHTGAHIGYTLIPNQLSLGTYLYNGWGTTTDSNFMPSYGFQLKWTPNERLTWIYNALTGPEQATNNQLWKTVHESNLSYTITPTLSFASDFLYGMEQQDGAPNKTWYGAQLGLKWQTSPTYYVSPRIEFYRDPHGYTLGTGEGQSLATYTLTQSYLLSEGFEFRLEGRLDQSTLNTRFITRDGTSATQPTVLLGVLYTI